MTTWYLCIHLLASQGNVIWSFENECLGKMSSCGAMYLVLKNIMEKTYMVAMKFLDYFIYCSQKNASLLSQQCAAIKVVFRAMLIHYSPLRSSIFHTFNGVERQRNNFIFNLYSL